MKSKKSVNGEKDGNKKFLILPYEEFVAIKNIADPSRVGARVGCLSLSRGVAPGYFITRLQRVDLTRYAR
jgi:hypothetical protein